MAYTITEQHLREIDRAEGKCHVNTLAKNRAWLQYNLDAAIKMLRDFDINPRGNVVTITCCHDGAGTARYPKNATYVSFELRPRSVKINTISRRFARYCEQMFQINGNGYSRMRTEEYLSQRRRSEKIK